LPNSRITGNGGTIPGELISLSSDHRVPSTEPLANLAGIGRSYLALKKASLFLFGLVFVLFVQTGSAFAETPLSKLVNETRGVDYKWGGVTLQGFDCSGFTLYVFKQLGVELARVSRDQAKLGTAVPKDELRRGDLIFFNTFGSGVSHVGIYIGNNQFIHSAYKEGVTIDNLSESYYKKRYITARRVLSDEQYEYMITDSENQVAAKTAANES
jgi:cell wall-associated NlpC family hydrolase